MFNPYIRVNDSSDCTIKAFPVARTQLTLDISWQSLFPEQTLQL